MGGHVRLLSVTTAVVIGATLTAYAQWHNIVTKVPLTPSGTPNLSAPAPKLTDGRTPDLSGVWDAEKRPCDDATSRLGCIDLVTGLPVAAVNIASGPVEVLPMRPWAEALVKQRRGSASKDDPTARCLPLTSPRAWSNFGLQKIIQTSESLTILDEYMLQYRQIFLDGRALPTNPEPMFKGYSVGRWEGDTVVVETVGFKDDSWLDLWGHPLTTQARTIERIRRSNYGSLEVALTVDDPKAYTKPWNTTIKLALALNTELLEYVCNENEKSLQHMIGPPAAQ
jgi:hypothetical protein